MSDELLPCPFCGSENVDWYIATKQAHAAMAGVPSDLNSVACDDCECTTAEWPTKEKAIEVWNTRTQQAGEALIELVRQAYLTGINDTEEGSPRWCRQGSRERAEDVIEESEYTHPPASVVPEANNIKFVDRSSDFSVKVNFTSCRAATEFEKFIKSAQGG